MFPRLRALNDDDSNSFSDEDGNKRPSKEAQEEQTIALYNKTLLMMAGSEIEEAIKAMEDLLTCPYLNEEEKTSSPIQNQIRLGCLKNLSTMYCQEPHKNLEGAQQVLMKATQMDPKNVNLWNKLGQVALSSGEYHLSHVAFIEALRCSPNHWGCIENLVTLSYVINDPKGCLRFCALGLEKDSGFLKGLVFRDHIFKIYPSLREFSKGTVPNYDCLMVDTKYDDKWIDKFLTEARDLTQLQCEKYQVLKSVEDQKHSSVIICPFPFKSFNLVELCKIVLDVHAECKQQGTFCRPINLTGSTAEEKLQKTFISEPKEDTNETAEDNNGAVRRSISLSEEKENVSESTYDETNETSANGEAEEYLNGSQSALDQSDNDGSPKKKSRKDVKWWQLEGKRRSQRVRGHLLPTVPNKPKSENGFSELLRNIIPPSLLTEEDNLKEREDSKTSDGKTSSNDSQNYFGCEAEILDVKKILEDLGTTDIITVVLYLTDYLASNCKRKWPQELASDYLRLYTVYMSHTQRPDVNSVTEDNLDQLQSYCFIVLGMLELCSEELTMNGLELLNAEASLSAELNYLYEILSNKVLSDKEIMLRLKWLQLKHSLALCQGGYRSSCKYEDVMVYLNLLKESLSEDPDLKICIHTKTDSIISLHEVEKKLHAVNRMRSLNKINELYEAGKYTEVIEILKFCFEQDDVSSVCDAKNRLFLAESYFQVGDLECVTHCVKAIQSCIRSRNEMKLDDCVSLLERICVKLNSSLKFREQRLIANTIIHILLFNEKRANCNDILIDTPWCILHRILYRMEIEEPVLYLEEESVPNSVLVLQMAHEILSRSGKCTLNNGKLLVYTVNAILLAKRSSDHYWMFEETKHVIEQAIFCLYGHPSKKSKLRYLSEHNITGINLDVDMCLSLYEYYKPLQLPEFDSYDSISSEVEILFKRILAVLPEELKPTKQLESVKQFLDESVDLLPEITTSFPNEYRDIYYLLADRNFKGKEWTQAVANYALDVTINPSRFDSWASLALAKGEMINTRLNSCDDVTLDDLVFNSSNVLKCFLKSLDLEPTNMKIRIEFGSFAYAMHSFCSRFLKYQGKTLTFDRFLWIEDRKTTFLTYTLRCFDPELKEFSTAPKPMRAYGNPDDQHDEIWMQHYMMGKVMEKGNPVEPTSFLKHYILAAELLHKQGAPYPAKINFYNPPELAIEALEIYYRIHASILRFVEKNKYKPEKEKSLLYFINLASVSPFIKSKQSRSGESSDSKKRKQSVSDDATNKKEVVEVLNDVLSKVEFLVDSTAPSQPVALASRSNSQSIDDSSSSNLVTTKVDCSGLDTNIDRIKPGDGEDLLKRSNSLQGQTNNKSEDLSKLAGPTSILDSDSSCDFPKTEWGNIVSKCVKAMQECIARFPQHHKAYFRLARALKIFKNDCKAAKEVFIGSATQKKKLCGLFGDRKANNFFNGVWRNPIDDIDRPGSFPFHMTKSVQLLLEILTELNDHQLLAEIGVQLTKVPDSDKKYLITEERENFSQKAFTCCAEAAKKYLISSSLDIPDTILSIYDSFIKLNKYNPKDNIISEVLVDAYKLYFKHYNQDPGNVTVDHAIKFCQNLAWTSKTVPSLGKSFMPGKIMPLPIEAAQSIDAINSSEPNNTLSNGLPKKKKVGLGKRVQGKATTSGITDSLESGNKTGTEESTMAKKIKKPLPQLTAYPRPEVDQAKEVVCLDLTQEDPVKSLISKVSNAMFSNSAKDVNQKLGFGMGLPKHLLPTSSMESLKPSTVSTLGVPGITSGITGMTSGIPGIGSGMSGITSVIPGISSGKDFTYGNVSTSANSNFYANISNPLLGTSTASLMSVAQSIQASHPSSYSLNTETPSKMPILQRQDIGGHSSKFSTRPPISTSASKFSPGLAHNRSSTFSSTPGKECAATTTTFSSLSAKPSPKMQVAMKSTAGSSSIASRSRSPSLSQTNVPYSSALNTSPYKQQANAVSTPSLNFGYGSDMKIVRTDRPMATNKIPPVAHCHEIRRLSVNSSNSPEPEIIDLTVKSPTKQDIPTIAPRKRPINNPAVKRRNPDPSLRLSKRGTDEDTVSAYCPVNNVASASSQIKIKPMSSTKDASFLKNVDPLPRLNPRPQMFSVKPSTSSVAESEANKKSYPLPPKKKKMLPSPCSPSPPARPNKDNNSSAGKDFEVITLD